MTRPAPENIIVCGQADRAIEATLTRRVEEKISAGAFRASDIAYVAKIDMRPIKSSLQVSPVVLEKLRRLCQLWDVDMKPAPITSHRPVIGPLIVLAKRIAFPIVRFFMKKSLEQQRDFNAAAISLLAEIANQQPGSPQQPGLPTT